MLGADIAQRRAISKLGGSGRPMRLSTDLESSGLECNADRTVAVDWRIAHHAGEIRCGTASTTQQVLNSDEPEDSLVHEVQSMAKSFRVRELVHVRLAKARRCPWSIGRDVGY